MEKFIVTYTVTDFDNYEVRRFGVLGKYETLLEAKEAIYNKYYKPAPFSKILKSARSIPKKGISLQQRDSGKVITCVIAEIQ